MSPALRNFSRWTERETSPDRIVRFRIAFALVWLAYDVADVALGGTALSLLGPMALEGTRPRGFVALQAGLILSELGLLSGVRSRAFAASACVLRSVFAWRFCGENDFLYFIVTSFLLAAANADGAPFGKRAPSIKRWPEDALLYQVAWTYFATALLKLNPAWLSGDTLFVRTRYLAATGFPLAAWLERLTSHPTARALATLGVAAEVVLAVLVLLRRRRREALVLSVSLHLFAALATDVWFFGASMVCQVWALLPSRRERETS